MGHRRCGRSARVAADGDRHQAVKALTSRAGYVVLLTATPHSGDPDQFQSLCSLGSHGERLLVFRRTRQALQSAVGRRIHRHCVRSTPEEHRMRARLEAFARAVRAERGDHRDVWIALALLQKRAFSSAHALWQSVTRRLDSLTDLAPSATQLLLPLDEDGELTDADETPRWQEVLGLRDRERERRLLTSLADAAAIGARAESKIRVIRRLLRRITEPLIILTEYRDTLVHLRDSLARPASLLHGGFTREERAAALADFTSGRRTLLLATDAAAMRESSSHLPDGREPRAPWNPMRLNNVSDASIASGRREPFTRSISSAPTRANWACSTSSGAGSYAQADIGAPDPLDGALNDHAVPPIPSDRADVSWSSCDSSCGARSRRTPATKAGR